MIRIRPLVGATLATLMFTPTVFADKVEVITPGNAGLAPPSIAGTGPVDEPRAELTTPGRTAAASSGGDRSSDAYTPPVEAQPGLQTMHFGGVSLTCEVASNARGLVVVNQSLETLPPGTRIKWQLKRENKRGYFAIIGELGGGQTLVADNVLDGSADADDTCVARVI